MTDLPQPLTPADCNLRGLPFMPMMVAQVMQSETFGLSTGDEFKAAFTLWCASWMEVPAGSLPSDDRMLEFLSRAKAWKKVKSMALRGWILCADGRLYHPVVSANALEAWDKRTDYREKEDNKTTRQQRWREQCKALSEQLRALGVVPPRGASLTKLQELIASHGVDAVETQTSTQNVSASTCVDSVEIGKTETVKRQLTTTKPNADDDSTDSSGASDPVAEVGSPREALFPTREQPPMNSDPAVQMTVALRRQGVNVMSTNPHLLQWVADGATLEQLTEAVAVARETKGDGVKIAPGYLVPILDKIRNPPAAAPKATTGSAPAKQPGPPKGMDPKGLNESYEAYQLRIDNELKKRKVTHDASRSHCSA